MPDNPALHQMNPQSRFTSRAEDYAKYRPSYPSEAIDSIVAGLDSQAIAADIGAGTGISSRLLADRGIKVMAIEPNTAMREVAQAHSLVEFRDGSAEHTALPDRSVDLVTCFQAFHWFDPQPTLQEFARILKPEGKIALVWNVRDVNGGDRFTREHDRLITQAANHSPIHSRLDSKSYEQISSLLSKVKYYTYAHQQTLDREGLIGLAMSASYLPQTGSAHRKLVKKLTELHQQYSDDWGLVSLHYQTNLYLWQLSALN